MSTLKASNQTAAVRVAIFYSNPPDTDRLLLDREHRALDEVAQKLNLPDGTFTRRHASRISDIADTLCAAEFEVVQFSGHGSKAGFFVESKSGEHAALLEPERMASILRATCLRARVILLISCYSSQALKALIQCAPYIITVPAEAEDEAAIEFCAAFYEDFFRRKSVESAFKTAQAITFGKGLHLIAILSRRAQTGAQDRVLFQVFPASREDSIIVDITEAEADLNRLKIPRDQFLDNLTNKIRIHRWLFDHSKERAILPLGMYFGLFSWSTARETVTCHKIMKLRPTASPEACGSWALLIVTYNDLFVEKYRTMSGRHAPSHGPILKRAGKSYRRAYESFFGEESTWSRSLAEIVPEQSMITKAMIAAHLEKFEEKLAQDDLDSALLQLEIILTSIHDFVTAIAAVLTE